MSRESGLIAAAAFEAMSMQEPSVDAATRAMSRAVHGRPSPVVIAAAIMVLQSAIDGTWTKAIKAKGDSGGLDENPPCAGCVIHDVKELLALASAPMGLPI